MKRIPLPQNIASQVMQKIKRVSSGYKTHFFSEFDESSPMPSIQPHFDIMYATKYSMARKESRKFYFLGIYLDINDL